MVSKKDLLVLAHLRNNGRKTLTELSKATSIPISTIFERLRAQREHFIRKFTVLVDFNKLGFTTRAAIVLKVKKNDRENMKKHLMNNRNVNSCFHINNGFDLLVDGVFLDLNTLEKFLEELDEKFSIEKQQVYFVIETFKEEAFLSFPEAIPLVEG